MDCQRYAYLALSLSFLAGENPGEERVTLATRNNKKFCFGPKSYFLSST